MARLGDSDFFAWQGPPGSLPVHYRLRWRDSDGHDHERIDPYSFAPSFGASDLTAFSGGYEARGWQFLGAQLMSLDGISGVRFALWAPNAERVSVVGPFCRWDGRCYPLRNLGASGVWEIFIPGLVAGELYKFELRHRGSNTLTLKSDPYGRASELRPGTASIVADSHHAWGDADWLRRGARRNWLHAPMSIYEVHVGSWRQHGDGRFYSYRELAAELIPYVQDLGLHAHRAAADHRASARRFLGLPDHRLFRTDQSPRHAR